MIIDEMKLKVDNAEFELIDFDLMEDQGIDKGKIVPSGKPKVRHFRVTYRSNGDKTVHNALKKSTMKFGGSIDFMAGGGLVDQIVFAKPTYCISHRVIAKAPDPNNDADNSSSVVEEALFLTKSENITW